MKQKAISLEPREFPRNRVCIQSDTWGEHSNHYNLIYEYVGMFTKSNTAFIGVATEGGITSWLMKRKKKITSIFYDIFLTLLLCCAAGS